MIAERWFDDNKERGGYRSFAVYINLRTEPQKLIFRDRSSQKSVLIEEDLRRIEKAFDRNIYLPMELYPAYEIKGVLTTIVDHTTGNYALKVKPTRKNPNPHYTRNVTVTAIKEDVYAELVHRIVDAIIELRVDY